MNGPIQKREAQQVTLRPSGGQLVPRHRLALTAALGVLAVGAVAGAAVAVFQVTLTLVTIIAIVVAGLTVATLLPALQLSLAATRTRAMEGVARAMPLETLIQQRGQYASLVENKERELARAAGMLRDYERLLRDSAKELSPDELAAEQRDLEHGQQALAQAGERLTALREDLAEFDLGIKRARIHLRLGEAKGSVAAALQEANLSAEQRHVTESALSEISRRAGQNAAMLDQALSGAQMGHNFSGTARGSRA